MKQNLEEFRRDNLKQGIIWWLSDHTILDLIQIQEEAVYEKSEMDLKLSGYENMEDIDFPKPLTDNSFPRIEKLEKNCKVISSLIKRTNLGHKERMILLFLYAKLGEKGVQRLKEVLSKQKNYKEYTTNTQINAYLNKNQLYGISCGKIREWIGATHCKGCKLYDGGAENA